MSDTLDRSCGRVSNVSPAKASEVEVLPAVTKIWKRKVPILSAAGSFAGTDEQPNDIMAPTAPTNPFTFVFRLRLKKTVSHMMERLMASTQHRSTVRSTTDSASLCLMSSLSSSHLSSFSKKKSSFLGDFGSPWKAVLHC